MVQAGWYEDPAGRHPHRYWDGTQWTHHVAGPSGQGIDPLPPAPPAAQTSGARATGGQAVGGQSQAQKLPGRQTPQSAGAAQQPAQSVRADPSELHSVLAELGIPPLPEGDGTPFGEPVLVLAFSAEQPDALEWWTPSGRPVAVATVLEKQAPGGSATGTDPATGAMVACRIAVTATDGTPIATTTRILKPAKPPTFVDDPTGRRVASVAAEKMFSKTVKQAVTHDNGAPIGRFVAPDMRAREVTLSDASGLQLARVVKYGKWDSGNVIREFSNSGPFRSATERLADRMVSAMLPIKREQFCSVVVRENRAADPTAALVSFLSPLLLEHTLSLL